MAAGAGRGMAPGGRKRAKRRPAEPEAQADPPEKRPRGKAESSPGDAGGPRVVIEHW